MQKITPHLWYDKEAKEAAQFYVAAFGAIGAPDTHMQSIRTIHDTPSGDCDIVSYELAGHHFMSISAGPYFKLNPSISFFVNFDPSQDPEAREHLDQLWATLSEGGKVLMELQEYPFSKHYGWVEDKFGLSWQLILTNPDGPAFAEASVGREPRPFIVPSIMYTGSVAGKAEEATDFYLSVFNGAPSAGQAKRGQLARYPAGMEPDKEGSVMFTDFMLEGQWFAAMDSAHDHKFALNEAVSFIVKCDTQEEIDYYWNKLSAVPESEQCGWCKDRFGVSWQITPTVMDEMMASGEEDKINRVTQAFLKMKKFDIAELEKAAEGNERYEKSTP